ncbi:hypothetical protein [La Joya virus]|uniref:Uncharacterized protein n=1 Tax=La Joya virus TaxID=1272946 RepID=A0A0D3R1C8_9RHAB|nr:hypothetical protein [La Joya virus]AJR28307.1 hypothetical protein [La Joya virus]
MVFPGLDLGNFKNDISGFFDKLGKDFKSGFVSLGQNINNMGDGIVNKIDKVGTDVKDFWAGFSSVFVYYGKLISLIILVLIVFTVAMKIMSKIFSCIAGCRACWIGFTQTRTKKLKEEPPIHSIQID